MAPVGTRHVGPPLGDAAPEIGRFRLLEDHAARLQQLGRQARILGWIEALFGDGDIACSLDEGAELGVGHLVAVDPKGRNGDLVRGALLRPFVVVAHGEGAALEPHRPGGRRVALVQAAIGIAEPLGRGRCADQERENEAERQWFHSSSSFLAIFQSSANGSRVEPASTSGTSAAAATGTSASRLNGRVRSLLAAV